MAGIACCLSNKVSLSLHQFLLAALSCWLLILTKLVTSETRSVAFAVPLELVKRLLWLPDHARSMGVHVLGTKGTGKSRLLGRLIAWLDFLRGVPLVVFDPHGPTIDNFLDKLTRLPREYQEQLWPRVRYVDMSGSHGQVVPFPLYYRLGDESLYAISQRYLDVVRKVDPWLMTASIEGFNALWNIGTYTGMILASLGFQITEAEHLIRQPKLWSSRFTQAIKNYPEARPAVDFFLKQYIQWSQNIQDKRSNSYRNKIAIFSLDPTMKAMFGASQPGIYWHQVIEKRLAVLLDFRHEFDIERRRFKMLWVFDYLLNFIKSRGAGRHLPVSLVIDELSALTNWQTLDVDIFSADLDELINQIARNYMVWLTVASQELFQQDPRIQKTLLTMGTQIIGSTSDRVTARRFAEAFYRYDPYLIKKYEAVGRGLGGQIYRTVEFTPEEQEILNSYLVSDQPRFHFLVRPAPREGETTARVYPVTIKNFDQDIYVNEDLVAQARAALSRRDAVTVEAVLSEVESRLAKKPAVNIKRPRIPVSQENQSGGTASVSRGR